MADSHSLTKPYKSEAVQGVLQETAIAALQDVMRQAGIAIPDTAVALTDDHPQTDGSDGALPSLEAIADYLAQHPDVAKQLFRSTTPVEEPIPPTAATTRQSDRNGSQSGN